MIKTSHSTDMSHMRSSGPRLRPLGSVKNKSYSDTVPKFPPLRASIESIGVHGAAMSVPPPRSTPERHEPEEHKPVQPVFGKSPRKSLSSKSDTSSVGKSTKELEDKERELREYMVREKDLKQQIMSLQKTIDELRQQLRDKEKVITELQSQFTRQEEQYNESIQKEKNSHEETKKELEISKSEVLKKAEEIEALKKEYDGTKDKLKLEMEKNLENLRTEKDKEIAIRDEKLNKLKKQMADALMGNSWERQQQLDELTKELSKVQEEADLLKMKLKSMSKSKNGACQNCDILSAKLLKATQAMQDRERMVSELKNTTNDKRYFPG